MNIFRRTSAANSPTPTSHEIAGHSINADGAPTAADAVELRLRRELDLARSEEQARAKVTNRSPESKKGMKKPVYIVGLASGLILARSWKFLVKEGIKAGVRAGREVKKVSDQVLEDLEDASAEAFDELQEQDKKQKVEL